MERKDHEEDLYQTQRKREFESDLHDIAFSILAPRSWLGLPHVSSIKYATSAKNLFDYVIRMYHVDVVCKIKKPPRLGYDLQKSTS